eukprot:scpid71330/ scgid11415/ Retinoid-inducible serine carboxypeptidase; Serine carboxypeptidase 1
MFVSAIVLACVMVVASAKPAPELGEKWGYVDVRPGAHMFWWLYGYEGTLSPQKPLVMWLQGGPGGSSTGFGNFLELGPLDADLQPRTTSWTSRANVLFVDNPVGTGFSYVDHLSLLTKTDLEIATDLVTLTEHFFKANPNFAKTPFYVFSESYGGKMTSVFGQELQKAILAGRLDINFHGVALGDGWVSPIDSMAAWVPYLYTLSLINPAGVEKLNAIVNRTRVAMAKDEWTTATSLWSEMENVVGQLAADVDWYNVLKHTAFVTTDLSSLARQQLLKVPKELHVLYKRHVANMQAESLNQLMNGEVKRHLGLNVTWGAQSGDVFTALRGAFMKNSIASVDYLLAQKVPVTIYQGQLDLIVPTIGTETYMKKLTWPGMAEFNKAVNKPILIEAEFGLFHQQYEHFNFFAVLKAGHMVPADQGEFARTMLTMVLGMSNSSK